jgi:hypothetical protein
MRIAMGLDDGLRAGATKLAQAVDMLPFRPSSPESMYVGAHAREAVAGAAKLATEGLELLGTRNTSSYQRASEGAAHLHRLAAGSKPTVNQDLLTGSIRSIDDLVRSLGNRAH